MSSNSNSLVWQQMAQIHPHDSDLQELYEQDGLSSDIELAAFVDDAQSMSPVDFVHSDQSFSDGSIPEVEHRRPAGQWQMAGSVQYPTMSYHPRYLVSNPSSSDPASPNGEFDHDPTCSAQPGIRVSHSLDRKLDIASSKIKKGSSLENTANLTSEEVKKRQKRERNRIAAIKCRRRKIERERELEAMVNKLRGEKATLGTGLARLENRLDNIERVLVSITKLAY